MTDIIDLADELYKSVNQQRVPEEIDRYELEEMVVQAIKDLYVISGRTMLWSNDKIVEDEDGHPCTFADTLL